ncbi:hypothetical protein [Nocardioides sp.]|uniref:hypothetical protein n=1 Tax=Nocardioides sp. TaxID=35761 RepID=UPI002725A958|nr:hypothetical protein [Nocardioides sp.]MDO9456142.1 hypothetical protein [Nocardioides sp.]
MPQSSHRARSRPGNQLLQTIGIVLVLGLIVAGIAVAKLSGADTAVADASDDSSLVGGPTTAVDDATDTTDATDDPTDDATTDEATEATEASETAATEAARAATARKLERKVDARKAELADRVKEAEQLARELRRQRELLSAPFDVRVGSLNVLGSQHTAPGGTRRSYPPASVRSPQQAGLISKQGLEIVGMQELQEDQLNSISSRTGLTAYPGYAWGSKETDNSILYDAGRFEMVSGDQFTIPFMGRPRPQPILRLRVRATGREFYVVNTHPSAGHGGRYAAERAHGQDVLVGVLEDLKSTGLPILLTGDMNDREGFYDRVVCRGGMVSASGGSGCASRPSQMHAVDWVAGSPSVSFTSYVSDTEAGDRRLTDHYFIHTTAHVG